MTPARHVSRRLVVTTGAALLAITACGTGNDQDGASPGPTRIPATGTAVATAAAGATSDSGARTSTATEPHQTPDAGAATTAGTSDAAAETWAVGVAGLGEAPTTPPPGFSRATLDRAVAYARKQLVAGNLDPATVYRRDTKPFAAATEERTRGDYLDLLASPAAGGRPYTLVSRLPDDARPDGDIRVKGRYQVKTKRIDGIPYMSLVWRGTFLYPVRDADGRDTTVFVHRRATWNWADDPAWAPGEAWYFEIGNADQCATQRSGLLVPDYAADHLDEAIAEPYGGGRQADNTEELERRC